MIVQITIDIIKNWKKLSPSFEGFQTVKPKTRNISNFTVVIIIAYKFYKFKLGLHVCFKPL